MCGRYAYKFTWKEIHDLLAHGTFPERLDPRFNMAPTQLGPVVRSTDAGLEGLMMKWGLIPSWADDPKIGNGMINARADGIEAKPAFRSAFKARRCLVPVSGFYEWQAIEGQKTKQPYFIQRADGAPMFFAGLWERWTKGDAPIESYTIITTEPNEQMAAIHNRMPVILGDDRIEQWMDPKASKDDLLALLRPAPEDLLQMHPVSTRVNSPKNDEPSLVQPV